MQQADPRFARVFQHIRQAIDLLEQVIISSGRIAQKPMDPPTPVAPLTISSDTPNLAYSVEEVRKIVGISRSGLCKAISAKELRAVKRGKASVETISATEQ